MLVLTRKSNQSVVVGGSNGFESLLKVTVLEITAGKVRLGFEIDAGVPVHRLEVWERIQADERASGPAECPAATNEERSRWEDDGGMRDRQASGSAALGGS